MKSQAFIIFGRVNNCVIEEGAYADLLLVDGNPLTDITVLGGSDKWFDADPEYRLIETIHLVMKDGHIYRNEIDGQLSPAANHFSRNEI